MGVGEGSARISGILIESHKSSSEMSIIGENPIIESRGRRARLTIAEKRRTRGGERSLCIRNVDDPRGSVYVELWSEKNGD